MVFQENILLFALVCLKFSAKLFPQGVRGRPICQPLYPSVTGVPTIAVSEDNQYGSVEMEYIVAEGLTARLH